MYVQRMVRLKDESIHKLQKILPKLEKSKSEVIGIEICYPPTKQALIEEIDQLIADVNLLVNITSIKDYEEEVERQVEESKPKPPDEATLLLSFS
jgi:hypothetical protein